MRLQKKDQTFEMIAPVRKYSETIFLILFLENRTRIRHQFNLRKFRFDFNCVLRNAYNLLTDIMYEIFSSLMINCSKQSEWMRASWHGSTNLKKFILLC